MPRFRLPRTEACTPRGVAIHFGKTLAQTSLPPSRAKQGIQTLNASYSEPKAGARPVGVVDAQTCSGLPVLLTVRDTLRVSRVVRAECPPDQNFGSGCEEDTVEQPLQLARALGQRASAVARDVAAPEKLVRDIQSG